MCLAGGSSKRRELTTPTARHGPRAAAKRRVCEHNASDRTLDLRTAGACATNPASLIGAGLAQG